MVEAILPGNTARACAGGRLVPGQVFRHHKAEEGVIEADPELLDKTGAFVRLHPGVNRRRPLDGRGQLVIFPVVRRDQHDPILARRQKLDLLLTNLQVIGIILTSIDIGLTPGGQHAVAEGIDDRNAVSVGDKSAVDDQLTVIIEDILHLVGGTERVAPGVLPERASGITDNNRCAAKTRLKRIIGSVVDRVDVHEGIDRNLRRRQWLLGDNHGHVGLICRHLRARNRVTLRNRRSRIRQHRNIIASCRVDIDRHPRRCVVTLGRLAIRQGSDRREAVVYLKTQRLRDRLLRNNRIGIVHLNLPAELAGDRNAAAVNNIQDKCSAGLRNEQRQQQS